MQTGFDPHHEMGLTKAISPMTTSAVILDDLVSRRGILTQNPGCWDLASLLSQLGGGGGTYPSSPLPLSY